MEDVHHGQRKRRREESDGHNSTHIHDSETFHEGNELFALSVWHTPQSDGYQDDSVEGMPHPFHVDPHTHLHDNHLGHGPLYDHSGPPLDSAHIMDPQHHHLGADPGELHLDDPENIGIIPVAALPPLRQLNRERHFLLPTDCWTEILWRLPCEDLLTVRLTCRFFRDLTNDDPVWHYHTEMQHLSFDKVDTETNRQRVVRHVALTKAENLLLGRHGSMQDIPAANARMLQMAAAGDHRAMMIAGVLMTRGVYMPLRQEAGMRHLRASNHPVAKFMIHGTPDFLIQAHDQEDYLLQYELGSCHHNGNSVEHDDEYAVQLYRQSAEQGYALAQYWLGYCYRFGTGVEVDDGQAKYWYQKSADQGYIWAREALHKVLGIEGSVLFNLTGSTAGPLQLPPAPLPQAPNMYL
eukprot:TRINITY_DN6805_c0_g1_i1.p1 TRINITY_DN6805_c0_g1~~TRINITY_DN6805_c0_g1_i1.p1  ORF type:complete len:408 (-),score=70.71 TRINITY_DN6805_c0_g1_i1:83-1306(-)